MKTIEKTTKSGQMMVRVFGGTSELQKFIKSTPVDDGWNDTTERDLDYGFCGAHSYSEACESMLKGTHVAELKRAVNKGRVGYGRPRPTLGVIGSCPNVPAVVSGSPACMYRIDKTKSPGAYNVYVDVAVTGMTKKQQIYDAGVQILIKVLQLSAKYPVNLYVGDLAMHNNKVYGSATQIINAGKAFNIARVSYAITEPGFLRVFTFCISERSGKFWPSAASSGYGQPLMNSRRKETVNAVFKNAIVLSTTEVIRYGNEAFKEIDKLLK